MSSTTTNLELFKYDTSTDGAQVFSIDTAMNANWDKIDQFAGQIKSLSNLSAQGEKRFTDINTELAKKLEAQVSLAENGYIKFNKGIIIQWQRHTTTGISVTLNLPLTFSNTTYVSVNHYENNTENQLTMRGGCYNKTSTTFQTTFSSKITCTKCFLHIGY